MLRHVDSWNLSLHAADSRMSGTYCLTRNRKELKPFMTFDKHDTMLGKAAFGQGYIGCVCLFAVCLNRQVLVSRERTWVFWLDEFDIMGTY